MSKRAEEFSIKYADKFLSIADKELSETNYSRHIKMRVHNFDGYDIEQAAIDGYEQAEKELTPLINRLCEAILFEWKDAADLARKTLTQIKAREE